MVLKRLQRFSRESRVARLLGRMLAKKMRGRQDLSRLEAEFRSLDLDGSGEVSLDELTRVAQRTGKLGKEEAEDILEAIDFDGSSKLSIGEFNHAPRFGTIYTKCMLRRVRLWEPNHQYIWI